MALSTYGRRPLAAFGSDSFHRTFDTLRGAIWSCAAAREEGSPLRQPARGSCTPPLQVTTYRRGY
jgi:hypothetical protein